MVRILLILILKTQKTRQHIELLSPAKNADFDIEAIKHGADALYIGGPAFGAQGTVTAELMTLVSGNVLYTLKFDCKPCEMHVMGKVRKHITLLPAPQPITFFDKRPAYLATIIR